MKKIPRSPFATRLSGSAREIELRIRSIFQWKKQRPPLALFLLMLVIGLLCGNLVSCQSSPAGVPEDPPAQSGEAWSTRSVLDALSQCFDAAESFPDGMERELLDTVGTGEDVTLAAAHFYDRYSRYSLVIGMVDRAGQVVGTPFEVRGSGGRPYVAAFVKDGVEYLLYTGSSAHQAYSSGQAGVIRLDGDDFSWVWPVEGDVRDSRSQAYREYNDYWEGRKPLLAPGGVDIFTENSDYGIYEGSPVQWVPHHNETFWYTAEQDLPIGVYYQSRGWLEEFTRHERNPWNALNTSALWQIVSLAPADGVYRDRNYDGEAVYELKARADSGEDLWFAASLLFDHSGERPIQIQSWSMGTKAEIDSAGGGADPQQPDEALYTLLRDWYNGQYPNGRWYFVSDQPSAPREGDVRLGPVTYVGEVPTDSGAAAVYEIVISRYTLHRADENDPGSWDFFSADTQFIVLRLDGEGMPTQVLGVAPTQPSRDIQAIVYEVLYGLLSGDVTFLRDGWNTPIGPGMDLSFSCLDTGSCETEQLEDYEPIYHDGDYWYRVSANYPTGTFTALCYHSAADDADSIHTLEASMSDLYTPRGIRVGASRAEVLEAYPQALTGDYWGQYPEESDLLAYLPWSGHDPEQISDLSQLEFYQGLGPAILFLFDGDTVERIVLTNMFN